MTGEEIFLLALLSLAALMLYLFGAALDVFYYPKIAVPYEWVARGALVVIAVMMIGLGLAAIAAGRV